MNAEKLTEKQFFHQRSLVGKGSYVQGPKQSYKVVAGFYNCTPSKQVREALPCNGQMLNRDFDN